MGDWTTIALSAIGKAPDAWGPSPPLPKRRFCATCVALPVGAALFREARSDSDKAIVVCTHWEGTRWEHTETPVFDLPSPGVHFSDPNEIWLRGAEGHGNGTTTIVLAGVSGPQIAKVRLNGGVPADVGADNTWVLAACKEGAYRELLVEGLDEGGTVSGTATMTLADD